MTLSGLTVMVTRPSPQGQELCRRITEEGGKAIFFPTVDILPLKDSSDFKQRIAKLDQYDMLIFVSRHAVYQSVDILRSFWPVFPQHLQVFAVGKTTAHALHDVKLPIHYYPEYDWNSEGLLNAISLKHIQGKKIGIVRGETGREAIANELRERGAYVDNMIVYRRVMPEVNVHPYKKIIDAQEINIIICTSNEILQNLIHLLGVPRVPVMVISERMNIFAKKLGIKQLYLANNASHDAIISELAKQKDKLCQMKKTNL